MGKTKSPPKKKPAAPPAEVGAPAPAPPLPAGLAAAPPPAYRGVLPLARLRPSPTNPRKTFADADLAGLAQSIRQAGVLQPLVVRPRGDAPRMGPKGWEGVDHFEVIAGERRFRAAALAGLAEVPVSAVLLSDEQVLYVQLVENEQRADVLPSERAAAFAALAAAGKRAEDVSAATGLPLAAVRDLSRLARLPAWALAAVDAGTLPRATAALVARVPGEAAREKAAAQVLTGTDDWGAGNGYEQTLAKLRAGKTPAEMYHNWDGPKSYREAKEAIGRDHTRQLKGAPFSLKMADLVPGVPSCEACPSRAGNDEEAKADGVRADVCLNPDCYRGKVEAHDAAELLKGTRKGYVSAGDDFTWPAYMDSPPKGWCDVNAPAQLGDLSADLQGTKHGPTKLAELLRLDRHAPGGGPLVFGVLDPKHRLRALIRTADARKLLTSAGVLKKPERKPAAPKKVPFQDGETFDASALRPKPKADGKPLLIDQMDVHDRAVASARRVLREYGEEQFAALADLPDAADGGPVLGALRLVARAAAYDRLVTGGLGGSTDDLLKERFAVGQKSYEHDEDAKRIDTAVNGMTAPQVLALLLELAAAMELNEAADRDTAKDILDWAELDYDQLLDQARRELAGEPTADERIAAAEAAHEDVPPVDAATYNARIAELKAVDRYWADDERQAKAAALWGGGCNPQGVFTNPETETVASAGKAKAEVSLVTNARGLWLSGVSLRTSMGGSSSPVSVWDTAHDTREAARLAAIRDILGRAESHAKASAHGASATEAGKIVKTLRKLLGETEPNAVPAVAPPDAPAPLTAPQLLDLDVPAAVLDLLDERGIHGVAEAWAACQRETPELAALPPRNRLMAWLVKLGAKAKPADLAAAAIAGSLPGDGKAVTP